MIATQKGKVKYRIRPEDMPPGMSTEEWMDFCDQMMAMMTHDQIRRQKELEEQPEVAFYL